MANAKPADKAPSAVRLLHRLIWLYVQASTAAISATLFLVLLGLEFTVDQWIMFGTLVPAAALAFIIPDIILIRRHYRPIEKAVSTLDEGQRPDDAVLADALVAALNMPFTAFKRVTGFHGPAAAGVTAATLVALNLVFDGDFETWQIITFAAVILFFASPAHAIVEFFAIARHIVPTVAQLSRELGELPREYQKKLVAVRLKNKLTYLSVFVTTLPLLFFAGSVVFKIERLFDSLGVSPTFEQTLPLWLWIGGVVIVSAAGAFVMSMLTANEVSRSTDKLIDAMRAVERGDLDIYLDVTGTDEYADLYRGFNLMTEGLREEVRMLELTHELSREIQLDKLLSKIMDATAELLDADRATLFLYDQKNDELFSRYAMGLEIKEIRIPPSAGIAGSVFQTGDTAIIADPYTDKRFNPEVDKETGYRTENILCMPIQEKGGKRIGVAQVLNKRGGRAFTRKDETRLRAFTSQLAITLENAQLFDEVLNVKNYNESILQSTSNGVITVDPEGVVVTANDAALEILNVLRDDFIGADARTLFHGENTWVMDSIAKVARTGDEDETLDGEIQLADGKTASVNLDVVPLVDANDETLGSLLLIEDITNEKRVKSTMARYMSKEVADQLLEGGEDMLVGKSQQVTILFADLRQFTTMAEAMGAHETVSLLNEYFGEMVDVIFRHQGILDKYIGDAIMALFGAPFTSPADADNAVATANDMVVTLRAMNERRAAEGRQEFNIGIGIGTGEVVLGNIGSPKRLEYTAIGDRVNLASRLEGATKYYGTKVLVSEYTVEALTNGTRLREIDLMRVKGKDAPVGVFEALDHHTPETFPNMDRAVAAFDEGFRLYRKRAFEQAQQKFAEALDANSADRPSQIYFERCGELIKSPPPADWDGVFVLTEK